jgi:hypothetical protein
MWIDAPLGNQGCGKQLSQIKERDGYIKKVNKKLRTCRCSAIKNYVTDLRGGFNEQLEKERVLLPPSSPRSAASHELSILCHKIEEDIINGNVNTNRIKLSHRPNGEGGRRHSRIVPH